MFCDGKCFVVSCPIADLTIGVQTAARAPFVYLFQVFTAEEGERWNRSKGVLEAQFVETHEGVRVNRRKQEQESITSVHCTRPVTRSHVGQQGEAIISLLNKLTTRDWGACVPTSPRTRALTKVMVGPRRLGPLEGWQDGPESR